MRRVIIAIGFFVSFNAHAQIPVTDVAAIAESAIQHIETVLKWKDQYDQMTRQFEKLKETHKALTGARNLGEVFDDPKLRGYLPPEWNEAYRAMKRQGYEGLVRKGVDIYRDNQIFDACERLEDEDERKACEAKAVKPSQDQGDASEILEKLAERSQQIKDLQSQINETEDPKAIAELQARLMVEQAAIANEATRVNVTSMIMASEAQVQDQRQREIQERTWAARKGVEIEPLTFPGN